MTIRKNERGFQTINNQRHARMILYANELTEGHTSFLLSESENDEEPSAGCNVKN